MDETKPEPGEKVPGNTGRGNLQPPWTKGDPRCNRKGRPKSAKGLRKMVRGIARELITSGDGRVAMSRLELIFRDWAQSRDYRKQQAFVESGYGKVANVVEVGGKGGEPIVLRVKLGEDSRGRAPDGDSGAE